MSDQPYRNLPPNCVQILRHGQWLIIDVQPWARGQEPDEEGWQSCVPRRHTCSAVPPGPADPVPHVPLLWPDVAAFEDAEEPKPTKRPRPYGLGGHKCRSWFSWYSD